jgi:hypothetical protein
MTEELEVGIAEALMAIAEAMDGLKEELHHIAESISPTVSDNNNDG